MATRAELAVQPAPLADAASPASNIPQRRAAEAVPVHLVFANEPGSGWHPTSLPRLSSDAAPAVLAASRTAAPSGSAVPPPSTTLAALEALAIESSPTLVELQARVDAASGRQIQVGLPPNPRVGFSAQELGNEDADGQYGAYASQEFVRGGKLELNRSAADWAVARTEQELAAQRLRVLTDVRIGFYSVLVTQERIRVAKELHSIALQAVEKARDLIKVEEPDSVLGQAEIEAELAAIVVENAQTKRIAQWRRMSAAIGQPDLPIQNLEGDLASEAPQIAWESALDRLRRESPELMAAAASVEQSRKALDRASVQAIPNVTVQAGLFYDDASSDPFASLQMSMPLPVYDWNQGGISEAQANVIAAEQAMQRAELSLQERLATVFQQYQQARLQATRYGTVILPKARRNLDLSRLSYESGDASYLDVLTTQRTFFQAELARLNAVERLWLAAVQIDGLLLKGSL
jgi:cobalt-zinc-cadmium efflux system outer membrane protein